jgi:hypothetical protein
MSDKGTPSPWPRLSENRDDEFKLDPAKLDNHDGPSLSLSRFVWREDWH